MQKKLSSTENIDVVYTWCDGEDPAFLCEKNELLKKKGLPYLEKSQGMARFFDNDELKYSLRSIEKYMPWVNHIFVVTNKQRPKWLANHPKISIVDHREIIPNELLPTFNSVMIEMYLHKIPNLSEKYIYFNDDMFVNAPLTSEFFFEGEKPIVRLTPEPKYPKLDSLVQAEELSKSYRDFWFKTVLHAWILAFKRYGRKELYCPCHVADAYTKTMVEKTFSLFPELLTKNNTQFRSESNIQRVILSLVMAYEFNATIRIQKEPSILYKIFLWRFKSLEWFSRTESARTFKRINQFKPKLFSINTDEGMDESKRVLSKEFFESHFPEKSSFEI